MKRKVLIFALIFMLIVSVNASANVVTDGISELLLSSEHYYNTKVKELSVTVAKLDEENYYFSHMTESMKTINTQFYRTEWGTWNLGTMTFSDGASLKTVIGGGTDWEYVLRVVNPITQNTEFTGGNHASELLVSLKMYDGVTGEQFELSSGEAKTVSRLVIEENTKLLLANLSYMPYANVRRVYTITGDTISLDCDISFLREVKMALSYSAMACVNKDFSRYCMFDNGTVVTSAEKGAFSNKRMGNTPSAVCFLSGDDPSLTLEVGIYNVKDMTDNFSNNEKTFIWDMTEEYNKLYFSKYNTTTLNKIPEGTLWKFGSYWKVNIQ